MHLSASFGRLGAGLLCAAVLCANASAVEAREARAHATARPAAAPARALSWNEFRSLTPLERAERKRSIAAEEQEEWRLDPPEGWRALSLKGWCVLAREDSSSVRGLVEELQQQWSWMERTFGWMAPAEHARAPIVLVHEGGDDLPASFRGEFAPAAGVATARLACSKERDKRASAREALLAVWFQEKDRDSWNAMPAWLKTALRDWLADARAKSAGFDPACDESLDLAWRSMLRADELLSLRDVALSRGLRHAAETGGEERARAQATRLVAVLAWGRGVRAEEQRALLVEYLRAARAAAAELAAEDARLERLEPRAAEVLEPWDEQEFLAAWDARSAAFEERVAERAWKATFARLDPRTEQRLLAGLKAVR
jgi:hypothetical protein